MGRKNLPPSHKPRFSEQLFESSLLTDSPTPSAMEKQYNVLSFDPPNILSFNRSRLLTGFSDRSLPTCLLKYVPDSAFVWCSPFAAAFPGKCFCTHFPPPLLQPAQRWIHSWLSAVMLLPQLMLPFIYSEVSNVKQTGIPPF